jgi:AcrR family transcriptional regulator
MPRRQAPSYHHGDLRAVLLKVAMQILRSEGLAALSLREVARRAGVSHQAPYHHFPTRGHLMAALACDGFTRLGDELDRIQAAATDPVAAAQETGVRYVTFAAENPERFRLMFGSDIGSREPYPDLAAAADRVFAALVRPFGISLRHKGAARDPVVLTLWSTVHGLAALVVDGQIHLSGEALESAARATTQRMWLGVREAITSVKR